MTMKAPSISKPLQCDAIYLKGKDKPLRDRLIFLIGSFVVVAKDEEDTAPTWYNVDQVTRMEGVRELPPPKDSARLIW